jgi:hypothetical protein
MTSTDSVATESAANLGDGPKREVVEVAIVTHLDNWKSAVHPFNLDRDLQEQVAELCEQKSWVLEAKSTDPPEASAPVLLHGATDFFVTTDELVRLPKSSETRLGISGEVLQNVLGALTRADPRGILSLQALAHNARPDSWFLSAAVQQKALQRICERPEPANALEWEAVLAAVCALLDDDGAQDQMSAWVLDRHSARVLEFALRALHLATTRLAVSYACTVIRHVLLSGSYGLAAIYRAEVQLRVKGEEVSFAGSLVNVANDGDSDALVLLNDVLVQCEADCDELRRLKQEIHTEASATMVDLGSLLDQMKVDQRLKATLRFAVPSESRRQAASAGLLAAQAAREAELNRVAQDALKQRNNDRKALSDARREVRRMGAALKELAKFLDMKPNALKQSVKQVLRYGWGGPVWKRGYTPLHVAAELGKASVVPLLLTLSGDPEGEDDKGRTPIDIAVAKGHTGCAEILRHLPGTDEYQRRTTEGAFLDEEVLEHGVLDAYRGCQGKISRCCARLKFCVKSCCKCRRGLFTFRSDEDNDEESGIELVDNADPGRQEPLLGEDDSFSGEVMPRGLDALDEEKVRRYRRILDTLGEEETIKRLQAVPSLGGLALTSTEVFKALATIREGQASVSSFGASASGDSPKGKGKGPSMEKGKGKGAKGKTGGVQPTKAEFAPPHRMKPLWWTRILVSASSTTKNVWANVPDYLSRLHDTDFATLFQQVGAGAGSAKTPTNKKEKVETCLRILTDRNAILAKEIALKNFPRPADMAEAVLYLDKVLLTTDRAHVLLEHACPSPEMLANMSELLRSQPDKPWALAESYMWEMGHVPFVQARLRCFLCVLTYNENLSPILDELTRILKVCQDIRASASVRNLLGCVLACGNYLNGGTTRGQADGFDCEQLGKIHLVKDNSGKDLRHFICTQLVPGGIFADVGEKLFDDISGLTQLVRRHVGKTADGADFVSKKIGGNVEELDRALRDLFEHFQQQEEVLQACLQSDELEADDVLRMELPNRFEEGQRTFENARLILESAKAEFKKMQLHFVTTLKVDEFFLLWDDLLLPTEALMKPAKIQTVTPTICLDQAVQYQSFVALWKQEEKKPRTPRKATAVQDARQPSKQEENDLGVGGGSGNKGRGKLGKGQRQKEEHEPAMPDPQKGVTFRIDESEEKRGSTGSTASVRVGSPPRIGQSMIMPGQRVGESMLSAFPAGRRSTQLRQSFVSNGGEKVNRKLNRALKRTSLLSAASSFATGTFVGSFANRSRKMTGEVLHGAVPAFGKDEVMPQG